MGRLLWHLARLRVLWHADGSHALTGNRIGCLVVAYERRYARCYGQVNASVLPSVKAKHARLTSAYLPFARGLFSNPLGKKAANSIVFGNFFLALVCEIRIRGLLMHTVSFSL